ncbi:unnamed protein product [Brassicogethes aeneus]|uniref:Tetratricopeptide repeat protein 17 n=1 Tax=Brassicogethes aeneus TaxID=1431903 RepID=A0A9P0B691_BRAAE|nr:unnamed protein product [Brassicogethes aeneus]
MSGDNHQQISLFLYILCLEIMVTNSKTSYLWRLSEDKSKIVEVKVFDQEIVYSSRANIFPEEDPLFQIIASTEHDGKGWIKRAPINLFCNNCQNLNQRNAFVNGSSAEAIVNYDDDILDCGKSAEYTYYDNLVGVFNRKKHPSVPEPNAIFTFIKKKHLIGMPELDIDALEKKLKKSKKEKPKSIYVYNQIGQFYRMKGNAEQSIECFRKALSMSPHNAEVLLNLARNLMALQYLDDAIFLTRRSIEFLTTEKVPWQQYFTLGEIFRAYGHHQEAMLHFRHTLDLKPGFEPAILALKEMENLPTTTLHAYTLIIIVCLVVGVLLVIISSVDCGGEDSDTKFHHRHFNKAMAMRSLRFGVSQKRKKSSL